MSAVCYSWECFSSGGGGGWNAKWEWFVCMMVVVGICRVFQKYGIIWYIHICNFYFLKTMPWKVDNMSWMNRVAPWSPGLTTLDFFLWGRLKSVVYTMKIWRMKSEPNVQKSMCQCYETYIQESLCACLSVARNLSNYLDIINISMIPDFWNSLYFGSESAE